MNGKAENYWEKGVAASYYFDKLFPEEGDQECNTLGGLGEYSHEVCNNASAIHLANRSVKKKMTPDDWLEENGLTEKDLAKMLKDYPTTYKFEGDELKTIDLNVEYSHTDEITNTEQLIKSLLYWNPYLFGSDWNHRWNYERRPDDECTRNVYDPKDYEEAGCIKDILVTNLPKECLEGNPPFYCMLDGGEMPPLPVPPIVQPPLEPTPPVPIRPGWKIAEGSNFWTIDEAAPYWETEEGSKEHKAAKERGSWIETEASRYAQENPNAPPPIPSYYATDPCGEGKQPANASC